MEEISLMDVVPVSIGFCDQDGNILPNELRNFGESFLSMMYKVPRIGEKVIFDYSKDYFDFMRLIDHKEEQEYFNRFLSQFDKNEDSWGE